MLMLGIDPGLQATGWGLVSLTGSRLCHHQHGIIRSTAKQPDTQRLANIAERLSELIQTHQPDKAIIEEIFVVQNPKSALRLGMARGVAIMACGAADLALLEISARKMKQAITGTGTADKKQIAQMVSRLLNISAPPSDAADALGLAIAGLQGATLFPSKAKGYETSISNNNPDPETASPLAAAIQAALAKEKG